MCNFENNLLMIMNQEKLNKNTQAELFSANKTTVIAAIQKVGTQGNKLYLPILFNLLLSNKDLEIENEIVKLLGNIKLKETVPIFVEALETNKYNSIKKIILTACWQNGLDYHEYLPKFVQIVINDNWQTGFEAFTVIDNMEFLPNNDIIEQTKKMITPALKTANEQKTYFLQEILAKIT